jgi:hypothetical protein
MNTRKVVGSLPIPTFIPTSAQEFLDVTSTSRSPRGLPEQVVMTQSKEPLDLTIMGTEALAKQSKARSKKG